MQTVEIHVLDETERITPKSALRYRPIGNGQSKPLNGKYSTITTAPVIQRASRLRAGERQTRPPASRSVPLTPRPRARAYARIAHITLHTHPLLYIASGMIAVFLLWTIVSGVCGWLITTSDDIRYGRPRTFQTDQWVGHNEHNGSASHFVALNLNRHIEIIEFPGGDATHAKIYLGPQLYGTNDTLTPVTLTFADVKGRHKLDMIVNVQGSHIVFINDRGGFRPLLPTEQHQAEQFLKHANL